MSCLEDSLLPFAKLAGANFSGQDFSGSDLRGADFTEAIMVGTNFRCCSLGGVDFTKCDLRNADLRKANLQGAIMKGADLRGANLTGANLTGVNFYECSSEVNKANVYGVKGLHWWKFKEAIGNPSWVPAMLFGLLVGTMLGAATISPVSVDISKHPLPQHTTPP